MNYQILKSAACCAKLAATLSLLIGILGCPALYGQTAKQPCSAAAYREFDFWVGDWDVFEEGGSVKEARAIVTQVQGGCGLREQYSGTSGSSGESLSMYDPSVGEWQQTWVSNRGQIVVIHGSLKGGAMTLSGIDHSENERRLVRGVWRPESGGVRETAERSSDEGKTWTPWFDLSFRKRAPGQ